MHEEKAFAFDHSEKRTREPINVLGEELKTVTHFENIGTSIEDEFS